MCQFSSSSLYAALFLITIVKTGRTVFYNKSKYLSNFGVLPREYIQKWNLPNRKFRSWFARTVKISQICTCIYSVTAIIETNTDGTCTFPILEEHLNDWRLLHQFIVLYSQYRPLKHTPTLLILQVHLIQNFYCALCLNFANSSQFCLNIYYF